MNSIRIIVGEVFQSPMSDMNFPAYISYVNTAGKVSPRSMLELEAVMLVILEQQEKINQQNEENFKQIFEILAKLTTEFKRIVEQPVQVPTDEAVFIGQLKKQFEKDQAEKKESVPTDKPLICPECKKEFGTNLALMGHQRSHKKKS